MLVVGLKGKIIFEEGFNRWVILLEMRNKVDEESEV